MKNSRSLALAIMIALPVAATAVPLDLTGQGYFTYGNTNTYSMPLSALQYAATYGGGAGPGNPYYINSSPGAIKSDVVIYTGAGGTDVTTNATGFENAYQVPNGSPNPYASIGESLNVVAPAPLKTAPEIANMAPNSWDANLLALKGFLAGGAPIFLFNNNDTGADQSLAIWARLWITDSSNSLYGRNLYLTNRGLAYDGGALGGSFGGIPSINGTALTYDGGNVLDPTTTDRNHTDFVRSGGDVTDPLFGTVNHNLGANQVAYAADLPLLDQWLGTLFTTLSDDNLNLYTLHLDLRLGCVATASWGGDCTNVAIDDGYEQLFLVSSVTNNTNVPEPATLALFGAALAGLALTRRRRDSV